MSFIEAKIAITFAVLMLIFLLGREREPAEVVTEMVSPETAVVEVMVMH